MDSTADYRQKNQSWYRGGMNFLIASTAGKDCVNLTSGDSRTIQPSTRTGIASVHEPGRPDTSTPDEIPEIVHVASHMTAVLTFAFVIPLVIFLPYIN